MGFTGVTSEVPQGKNPEDFQADTRSSAVLGHWAKTLMESQGHSRSPGTKSVETCNSYMLLFFVYKDFPLPYFF